MDLANVIASIEASGVGEWMRTSLKAMPVVEAIHVLTAATVFGTILIVDLRLLGFPNARRPFTRVSHELMWLTWGAFFVSVITGTLMFIPNATTYYGNTPFKLKMLALLVAGVNMAVFELGAGRSAAGWDRDARAPLAGRFAGGASIVIWVAVIFIARWIGFTKGYVFDIPADVNLDLDFPGQ